MHSLWLLLWSGGPMYGKNGEKWKYMRNSTIQHFHNSAIQDDNGVIANFSVFPFFIQVFIRLFRSAFCVSVLDCQFCYYLKELKNDGNFKNFINLHLMPTYSAVKCKMQIKQRSSRCENSQSVRCNYLMTQQMGC